MTGHLYTIEVTATERTTKDGSRKFITYETYKKDGRRIQLKFTKMCGSPISRAGRYTLTFDDGNISNATRFETLWVRNVITCTPISMFDDEELPL